MLPFARYVDYVNLCCNFILIFIIIIEALIYKIVQSLQKLNYYCCVISIIFKQLQWLSFSNVLLFAQ